MCYNALLVHHDNLKSTLDNIDITSQENIDTCVNNFTECFTNIMSPFFKKKSRTRSTFNHNNNGCTSDKPWFDNQCKELYIIYCRALDTFNGNKSYVNHTELNRVKFFYKGYELKCKRIYKRQEGDMFNRLKKDNPRKFYSLFRKKKQQSTCNLSLTDFFDYFKKLVSDVPESNRRPEIPTNDCVFEELDVDITADEILKAINELKRDKSHGPDCM